MQLVLKSSFLPPTIQSILDLRRVLGKTLYVDAGDDALGRAEIDAGDEGRGKQLIHPAVGLGRVG